MAEIDSIFQQFVGSLDDILRDTSGPASFRQQTVHLVLTVTASVGQGSLNSYFLRRDFFATLCKVIFFCDACLCPKINTLLHPGHLRSANLSMYTASNFSYRHTGQFSQA